MFSEQARKVLGHTLLQAGGLGYGYLGPEHLLLGLLQEDSGVAMGILTAHGANREDVEYSLRQVLLQIPPSHSARQDVAPPFTPRAKRILGYARVEAHAFRRKEIDTEHLLLGMLIEGENVASVVLNDFGITLDSARMEAIRLLGLQPSEVGPAPKEQPDTEQDVNWDSVLTPNVPPLSETGRKVRKGLAWGTPVLILAGGLGILFYENHPALPLGGASIFVALVYLNLLAWLFFVALFRLQAFILELLIILPVCSLPVGVALNMDQSVEVNRWIIGAIGVLLLAGGSVWGLSLAQRSGERRSWPRLGFIALGWGLSLGITAFPLLFLSLFSRRPLLTTAGEHILAAVFAAIAVVGLIVENRCAKRYGPMRVW